MRTRMVFCASSFRRAKDLSIYTLEDLARAEKLLNNRPRKIPNWSTPDRVFIHGLP